MQMDKLTLQNFRNYQDESFLFSPGVNIICGENGQGKTNLLEALAACATMRLFRTQQRKEGLRFGEDLSCVYGALRAQERHVSILLRLSRTRPMEIFRNGVRQKRQSDMQGVFQTVLFCPEDLALVRQGAAVRRKFLDTALCQLRPNYARSLEEYRRLYQHKTRILRDGEQQPSLLSLWEDFSIQMAQFGAQIIRYRAYYCKKLLEEAARIHAEIAPHETLSAHYQTVSAIIDPYASTKAVAQQLIEHVLAHKSAEIAAKSCLSGPHKDDLHLYINDRKAAAFASQGQTRTCALSLKLAEREMFHSESKEYPVLLLDDVLSELDHKRQDFVLNHIAEGQTFITCCEDNISERQNAGSIFFIQNGKIISQK